VILRQAYLSSLLVSSEARSRNHKMILASTA